MLKCWCWVFDKVQSFKLGFLTTEQKPRREPDTSWQGLLLLIFELLVSQPPATAGTILTSSPSLSGVSVPSKNRISSLLTYKFKNRRGCPCSSQRRDLMPGKLCSRDSISSAMLLPLHSSVARSLVNFCRGVGISTLTGIWGRMKCEWWIMNDELFFSIHHSAFCI